MNKPKYKKAYQIPRDRLSVKFEFVSGDRCPADAWRVSLILEGKEVMFNEWFTDVNGNDVNGSEDKARALYNKLRKALHE